jgi:microcystin-dependent protein
MSVKSFFGDNGYPIPVGVVMPYAGFLKPEGYLLCDGSPILQADYPQLFRVLDGVGYGQNATQFNTPNLVDCFIQGTAVNSATAIPASTGGDTISFSVSEAQMPNFSTNTQSGIGFSTNNIGHDGLITTNGGDHTQSGGSPTSTFLGRDTTTFPAGSVSVVLSNTTASYTGTGSVQTVAISDIEPKHYTMAFYIRADY